MKIDSANKAKIIIFASMGIAIILVIMLFIFASSKEDKVEDVSVRMDEQHDLTINDILNQQESTPTAYDSPVLLEAQRSLEEDYMPMADEDEEVKRLQDQLRAMGGTDNSSSANYQSLPHQVERREHTRKHVEPKQEKEEHLELEKYQEDTREEIQPQKEEPKKRSRFFSASEDQYRRNTIEAKVSGEQQVKNGGTLKLILTHDVELSDGTRVRKGTPVWGQVELGKNRLQVHISSIRVANDILPFRKTVYDRDGLAGIYIPDNTTAELAGEASSSVVNNATIGSTGSAVVDGTVQVIESVAKGAVNKRQSRPTITIKSNYKVLLQ